MRCSNFVKQTMITRDPYSGHDNKNKHNVKRVLLYVLVETEFAPKIGGAMRKLQTN
jgi:hypothetical protein